MPRANWKGTLSIGLLNVPVSLHTNATEQKQSFTTVSKQTGNKVKQLLVDVETGAPVDRAHGTDKKAVLEDGREVVVTQSDIDLVRPATSKVMQLHGFVSCNDLSPCLIRATHQVSSESVQALGLLAEALDHLDCAGIGTFVKGNTERLFSIQTDGHLVWVNELYWAYEMRDRVTPLGEHESDTDMFNVALNLVESMSVPFDLSLIHI